MLGGNSPSASGEPILGLFRVARSKPVVCRMDASVILRGATDIEQHSILTEVFLSGGLGWGFRREVGNDVLHGLVILVSDAHGFLGHSIP